MTDTKPPRHLLEIVLETRQRELHYRTGQEDIDIFESNGLDGWCHENAHALAERVYYGDTEWTPYLVWGGVANENYNDFDTIVDLEHSGRAHFWVEVLSPDDDRTVVLDLSCEGDTKYCQPHCGYSTPDAYRYMCSEPSYILFDPQIEPDDLLGVPEYEHLREARPELFCSDPTSN